jgi:hypothetical protein
VLRPPERLSEPFQTVRGQVLFKRDDCRRLLAALAERPLSWEELCAALPGDTPANLCFWLDLLIAAAHLRPFLPAADVAAIDRQRLRLINRQRLQQTAVHFSAQTVTPPASASALPMARPRPISWRRCGANWPVLKPPTSRAWATGGSMSEGSRV